MLTQTLVFTFNAVKHWNISNLLKIALVPWDIQMLPEFLFLDVACHRPTILLHMKLNILPLPEMH